MQENNFFIGESSHAESSPSFILGHGNEGKHLLPSYNSDDEKYHINVRFIATRDLSESEEWFVISSSIPQLNISADTNLETFLNELRAWADIPIHRPKKYNRKYNNEISYSDLQIIRDKIIDFNQVKINIFPVAESKMDKQKFIDDIKKIMLQQRWATDDEVKNINRFSFLLARANILKYDFEGDVSRFYDYKDFRKNNNKLIDYSKKEYNSELTTILKEMKAIVHKLPYLDIPHLDLATISKPPKYADWLEENEAELQEGFDSLSDEEKEELMVSDFDGYCKSQFEEFIENNEFD